MLTGAQLDEIGAPVSVDDEVGFDRRPGRLDHDMDAARIATAALGIADDPTHRVAGCDRTRARELLALLEGNVGDLPGSSVDLVERSGAIGEYLLGVEIPIAPRLDTCGIVRGLDASGRLLGLCGA